MSLQMNTGTLCDNIPILFDRLVEQIQQANKKNRNNKTVDAENLFCIILNSAFDWKLSNSNKKKSNQDSFDLESQDHTLCVQVTSNQNYQVKFKKTLKRFDTTSKGFEKLIIIFITKSLPDTTPKNGKTQTIDYEVYDIDSLDRKIYYAGLTSVKLQQINDELEAFTRPFLSTKPQTEKTKVSIDLPVVNIPSRSDHFYIDRRELVEQLYQFSQIDNGLIIGGPGIGKSFTIEELQRLCRQKNLPCYIILINELLGGTDKDFQKALSIPKGNWLKALRLNWLDKPHKALLIFDGFDTAKDEKVKAEVLVQMQQAIKGLSINW